MSKVRSIIFSYSIQQDRSLKWLQRHLYIRQNNRTYGPLRTGSKWITSDHGKLYQKRGVTLSRAWYPVTNMLTNQDAGPNTASI
jgi:hypothetical protein